MEDFVIYKGVILNYDNALGLEWVNVSPNKEIDDQEQEVNGFYHNLALLPGQTHSVNVGIVEHRWQSFPYTDALVTFEEGIPIGVQTADCVPILIYAPDVKGIAAVHAGWKGTLGGIVENTLNIFEDRGADPARMVVSFGPSISSENYEVDKELGEKFIEAGFGECVSWPNGEISKPHIDLQGANRLRLIRRGVNPENITLHDGCTVGSRRSDGTPYYYSHRRSNGGPGRNLTSIMLLEEDEIRHYERLFEWAARKE